MLVDGGAGLQKSDLVAVEMCEEFNLPYVVSLSHAFTVTVQEGLIEYYMLLSTYLSRSVVCNKRATENRQHQMKLKHLKGFFFFFSSIVLVTLNNQA